MGAGGAGVEATAAGSGAGEPVTWVPHPTSPADIAAASTVTMTPRLIVSMARNLKQAVGYATTRECR